MQTKITLKRFEKIALQFQYNKRQERYKKIKRFDAERHLLLINFLFTFLFVIFIDCLSHFFALHFRTASSGNYWPIRLLIESGYWFESELPTTVRRFCARESQSEMIYKKYSKLIRWSRDSNKSRKFPVYLLIGRFTWQSQFLANRLRRWRRRRRIILQIETKLICFG